MRYLLYLAINAIGNIIYLDEKKMADTPENVALFRDCINDLFDLKYELSWNNKPIPTGVGVYQAVIEVNSDMNHDETCNAEHTYQVLSVTPLFLL